MITRATLDDVAEIADLLNDPAIRPTVGGEGYLDPTSTLTDTRNFCLFSHEGGAMFAWRGPGVYEGHSFCRVRGRQALDLIGKTLEMMWDNGARMIWGLTPLDNKAARWFSRQLGFKSLGEMQTPEGKCELFVMEKS